jgi:hypothetical protein
MENQIENAIERSLSCDEIAFLYVDSAEGYREACALLREECDDNAEHSTSEGWVCEFWGATDDGADWRVHVRHVT